MQQLGWYSLFSNGPGTLTEINESFREMIVKCWDISQFLADPFKLFFRILEPPITVKHLRGRAYTVDDRFVYKYDEQPDANTLSFITSLFGKVCKIRSPNMVLAILDYHIEDGLVHHEPQLAQIMDYLPNWQNYSHDHPKDDKFVKQLAELLAFDLTVGNGDQFLFIFRLIDDIVFADDPEYESQRDHLWDDPVINGGNFGFVHGDLWSLDARPEYTSEQLDQLHASLTDEFLMECVILMGQYFELTNNQMALFHKRLLKQLNRNLLKYPMFDSLHRWVLKGSQNNEEKS